MPVTAHFAYVQVRLQARHGARPDEAVWRHLQSTSDFANFLQLARNTSLRPWVQTLDPGQGSEAVEGELRRLFRRHVDEVAGWVRPAWRPAVRWVRHLPDLPALQYLFSGDPLPAWIQEDPELKAMGCLPVDARLDAIRQSDCTVFYAAWQAGETLPDAWLARWQELWPKSARHDHRLLALGNLLGEYLRVLQADTGGSVQVRYDTLRSQLNSAFRRDSFKPAAVFIHLALTALELTRLRGELLVRQLFATNLEQIA